MRRSLLVVLVLLLTGGLATAADYIRIDADSLVGGTLGVLPFYITRQCPDPDTIMGASNGFVLTASGAATWTFNSFAKEMITYSWWNLGGLFFNNKIDGTSPDSFLTGGAAMAPMGGLPVVTEQLYFTLNLDLGLGGGELCIDSGFIPPAGTWKFTALTCGQGGAPDRPLFLAKDGSDANHPICITVVGEVVCPDPLVNDTPDGNILSGSHCGGLNFTFGADPGSGETIASWSVISGLGAIDAGGNYSVGATATGTYPVVVEVENGCGNTDDYAFNLEFTNANPAYSNTGGEDTEIVAGLQYSYDFNANDADACDIPTLTWSINSQSPAPTNPATISPAGLFSWQTDLADAAQSYDFQIQVTDGIAKAAVTYDFSVLVTTPVCTVPTVNVTPPGDLLEGSHCYISFQFGADAGMFGQNPATIAGWAVISGPGSIDGTGLYEMSYTGHGSYPVTVIVTNSCGETDDYAFTLNLTTAAPVFTNADGAPNTATAGDLYSYDFDATDADTCDTPWYNTSAVPPLPHFQPSIDFNSGLLEWQTHADDAGNTYTIEVWAFDGGDGTNTLYELVVEVTDLVCTAPTINLTPAADLLEGSHCAISFQFGADPGMLGQDPATIAGWDVTDGPGSIDGAGLYTVSLPNANTGPVTVEVTNSCGETDDYAFTLNLTTANPVFTNAEDAPDTACAGDVYSYDFDATDSDTCDTVLFASNTGTPVPMNPRSINSASGLFEWQPDPSEIGTTFQFEVWANDEGLAAKSDAMYLLEITVVSCVAEDPEITLIHGLLDFEMVVGNPDPAGQELQIANTGTGTLNWELANDSNWLVPTETSGSAPPTSSLMLNINSAGRPVGSYRDTVFVTGNAFNSPQYAIVDLEITEVPVDDEYAVWVGSGSGIPGDDVVIPVTFKNTQELSMIVLPLQFWGLDKITNGITLNSVSFSGSRVDYIASKPVTIDNGTQTVLMGVFVFTEDLIPADSGLMANLHFSIDPTAAPGIVPIDSIFIAPSNSLAFGDAVGDPIYPDFSLGQIEILPPPMPCVELSDSNFTFTGYECGPDPDPQYFDILNCGDIPISWEIIGSGLLPTGSVSFDPSFGNDDHYGVEISVDIDCLPVGTYYDTACVILTDPDKVPPGFQACIEIEVIITEPPEMNIAGEVIDDGTTLPIAGATVELYDFFPSSLLAATTTAGDGTFDFGPYTGSYVVRAYKNGYYQNWVNVTAPDENVQVALTPTDTPPPTPEWVNLYCDWATFEDYPILAGDVVEAYDPTGVLCGQFFVTTEGAYGFMAVYRDDGETTPAVDEGCDPGDAITVKLNGFDMTPFLDSPVSWTTNGDNLEACFDGYIEKEICLHLDSAWNLISWNVDTEDDAIDVVLADIMHLVEVVLGFEQGAMTFDPDLLDFSTLDFTDHFHGYWVKVSDSVTFCLTGLPVDPATPIHLEDGWNLASYLPNEPDSTPDALASIYSELIIALGYDGGGLTWDPANPDPSDLRYLAPGFGYWLKVLGDVDLIYSTAPPAMPVIADNTTVKSGTLSYVNPTRQWVDLYGSSVTVDGVSISTGTVVEAVSEDGEICGAFMVKSSGKLGFMPVYGDDATTRYISEGPTAGGSFHLVVNGSETKETFTWTSHADRVEVGALNSIGGHGGTLPSAYQLQQNYPNPFNPKTTISYDLGVDAHVTLTIYNILGAAVKVLVDEYQSANNDYTVVWDGTDLNGLVVSSGVYFYRLSAGEFSETKKMMLMK